MLSVFLLNLFHHVTNIPHILFRKGFVVGQEEAAGVNFIGYLIMEFSVPVCPEWVKPEVAGGEEAGFYVVRIKRFNNPRSVFGIMGQCTIGNAAGGCRVIPMLSFEIREEFCV